MDKTYVNATDGILSSRNPRLALKPGETLLVTPEMMSYSIRMWVRNGSLAIQKEEAKAEPVAPAEADVVANGNDEIVAERPAPQAKPAAKPAAKKPAARKPAAAAKKPAAAKK
jgi:hypothetical protein